MKRTLGFALIALSMSAYSQSKMSAAHQNTSPNEALAKPLEWHEHKVRLFEDSEVSTVFTLTTSWIPGADHKGMFRYKVIAAPEIPPTLNERAKYPELSGYQGVEHFVRRMNQCLISLVLYDSDGFLLRKVPLSFALGADQDAHITALSANDATQMDADEYRKLKGDTKEAGSYSIDWACREPPS